MRAARTLATPGFDGGQGGAGGQDEDGGTAPPLPSLLAAAPTAVLLDRYDLLRDPGALDVSGPGSVSSVHTLELTAQVPAGVEEFRDYFEGLEEATLDWRTLRSRHHAAAAKRARQGGKPTTDNWHRARAKGQLERFQRVDLCGEGLVCVTCGECGEERTVVEAHCRVPRLCVPCRGRRARRERVRFRELRRLAVGWSKRRGLFDPYRPEGRWGEKFITLTIPHREVREDVAALARAWRKFWRLVRVHLEKDRGVSKADVKAIPFVRVLEATPGTHEDGHAHYHVWAVLPFIPQAHVAHLWGRALESCGYPVPSRLVHVACEGRPVRERVQLREWFMTRRGEHGRPLTTHRNPVCDVRAAKGDIANELVKYMFKDATIDPDTGELVRVPVEVAAAAYIAVEGRRSVQVARGMRPVEPPKVAPCCGCVEPSYKCRIARGCAGADRAPP